METGTAAILISGALLAWNIIQTVYGGGWNLSSRLSNMEKSLRVAIDHSKSETQKRMDEMEKRFGEVGSALRQKIHEIELHIEKNYMRRESFYAANNDSKQAVQEGFRQINKRLDRMEEKIDSKA